MGDVPWLCFSGRLGWGSSAWCLACLVVDVVGGWVEGGVRRDVGWRVCVVFPEAFVTCVDVLLAPGGRCRLAACVVDGGWLLRRVHAPSGERALSRVDVPRGR